MDLIRFFSKLAPTGSLDRVLDVGHLQTLLGLCLLILLLLAWLAHAGAKPQAAAYQRNGANKARELANVLG